MKGTAAEAPLVRAVIRRLARAIAGAAPNRPAKRLGLTASPMRANKTTITPATMALTSRVSSALTLHLLASLSYY